MLDEHQNLQPLEQHHFRRQEVGVNTYPYGTGPCGRRVRPSSSLPARAQFPGLHAECIRKVPLQRDAVR
jgi:hypothetical protein